MHAGFPYRRSCETITHAHLPAPPYHAVRSSFDRHPSCLIKRVLDCILCAVGRLSRRYGRGDLADPELAGYRRDRLGLQHFLRAVEAGEIDMIACKALDWLARNAKDVAWPGKKLAYYRIPFHTVSEGHVDEIKFAVDRPAWFDLSEASRRQDAAPHASRRAGRALRLRAGLWLQAHRPT
ncbi:recombinase family protein [Sphingomonas aerolata]|uniref:recombinase family protein n=1 Tax=Sphingomonas aerolata TaxID=185951 RepID=UPI000D3D46F4|nr:recombinase family protein [Sphingomonas aerolata]